MRPKELGSSFIMDSMAVNQGTLTIRCLSHLAAAGLCTRADLLGLYQNSIGRSYKEPERRT